MEDIVDSATVNHSFMTGVQVGDEFREFLASNPMCERLHDELCVWALIGALENEKSVAVHAKAFANVVGGSTRFKGGRESHDRRGGGETTSKKGTNVLEGRTKLGTPFVD
jgi:hypothetical protein